MSEGTSRRGISFSTHPSLQAPVLQAASVRGWVGQSVCVSVCIAEVWLRRDFLFLISDNGCQLHKFDGQVTRNLHATDSSALWLSEISTGWVGAFGSQYNADTQCWIWNIAPREPGEIKRVVENPVFGFTALHGMQTRSSDENSVCPCVCQTRALWQNGRKICKMFITYERAFSLVFWEKEWLVGATPSTWNFGSTGPR